MPPNVVMLTLARVWPVLKATGSPVAIAGGIALSYWGNPRSTQDVDLVIRATESKSISQVLLNAGFQPKTDHAKDLGLFQLSQWSFEPENEYIAVEVDLMMSTSDYYSQLFSRTKQVALQGLQLPVSVLSREDLILHKLYAERMIDLADVENLLDNYWNEIDHDYLQEWSTKLTLEKAWREAVDRIRSSPD